MPTVVWNGFYETNRMIRKDEGEEISLAGLSGVPSDGTTTGAGARILAMVEQKVISNEKCIVKRKAPENLNAAAARRKAEGDGVRRR